MPKSARGDGFASAVRWCANWIAPPGEVHGNYTFLARKAFEVDTVPLSGSLHIAAESRYVAYLNGEPVGQGPARGTEARFFFDSHDIASSLRGGRNILALRVHCSVTPLTSAVPPVKPAVIAQIDGLVATDRTWEVCEDPSNRPDAPLYNHHIGYSEYRDLRLDLVGWEAGTDRVPTRWTQALEVAAAAEFGGRSLDPRPILPLADERHGPAEVVCCGSTPAPGDGAETDVEYAALMQTEAHLEAPPARFQNLGAMASTGAACVLPSDNGDGAFVILDFQREVVGNLLLDLEAPAGAILDAGYGEVLEHGRVQTHQVNRNGTAYRFADRYVLREGRQRIATRIHDRGFRFLQLVLRRHSAPVRFHSIAAASRLYPVPQQATFECDEDFLNRLWGMCCHTLHACCMDLFVDCPWREQTLWLDDHFQENRFYLNLTADPVFPAHNLRVGGEGALPSGQIPGRYPSRRLCNLPCTSANWIMVLDDYLSYTGDLSLVRDLLPVVDRALGVYEEWRADDGLVPDQHGPHQWNFIDWGYELAEIQLGGKTAALNLLVAVAFKAAARLHEAVGDGERAARLRQTAAATMRALRRALWVPDQGCFRDCTEPGDGRQTSSQLPHAVGLCYDLLDADQRAGALATLLRPEAIRAELGYQLLVLEALVGNGQAGAALAIVRQLWGEMVRSGSPTVWEIVEGRLPMKGCGSLCHAYACAPAAFMQTALLGVRPLSPGFETFSLVPQSLGVTWARGEVPTPHGLIRVAWSARECGVLSVEADIPEGTTAVLADGVRLSPGHREVTVSATGGLSAPRP